MISMRCAPCAGYSTRKAAATRTRSSRAQNGAPISRRGSRRRHERAPDAMHTVNCLPLVLVLVLVLVIGAAAKDLFRGRERERGRGRFPTAVHSPSACAKAEGGPL